MPGNILFLLWNYTSTIDSNVCNFLEMCSALFWICCTSFSFLMKTINIIPHVSICGTYLLYLRIVYIHNIFHITDGSLLCYARAFIRCMLWVFAVFIPRNITTTQFFFLFKCAWSIFLSLNIIHTWSFFMFTRFLVARSCYVDDLQFLILNCFVDVSNCFVEFSNFFVDSQFKSFGT